MITQSPLSVTQHVFRSRDAFCDDSTGLSAVISHRLSLSTYLQTWGRLCTYFAVLRLMYSIYSGSVPVQVGAADSALPYSAVAVTTAQSLEQSPA